MRCSVGWSVKCKYKLVAELLTAHFYHQFATSYHAAGVETVLREARSTQAIKLSAIKACPPSLPPAPPTPCLLACFLLKTSSMGSRILHACRHVDNVAYVLCAFLLGSGTIV